MGVAIGVMTILYHTWYSSMAEIQFPPPGVSKGPAAPTYKVLIIGDSNVGKTSLLNRYCDDSFQGSLIATVGKCVS